MKALLIVLAVLAAVALIAAVLCIYLTVRYSHVNPGLRFFGWLISLFTGYSTEKGLRRFAGMANAFMPLIFREKSRKAETQKVFIEGRDGTMIPAVVYRPKDAKPGATGFLWIHGGGYCIGTPGGEKGFLEPYVLKTGSVILVPDYRLSVKAPYPAAFHDCVDALLWMKGHAKELGIREDQLFVGGCSAGGGLTAAVALWARDSGRVNIAWHIPIYPMINDRMDTDSMRGNREMLWDERRNRAAWQVYLGSLSGTDGVPPYAAAARETDFSGLPPAYTFVGTLDPFRDETLGYVEALRACGIEARCDVYEAAFHGFDVIPSKISRQARAKLLEEYMRAQSLYFAPQKDGEDRGGA